MRALLLLSLVIAAPVAAAQTDWSRAPAVEVRLSSFDYDPHTIRLRGGQPVVLRLVNASGRGHDFSAPQVFALANVNPGDRARIRRGAVEVPGRETREIHLVPQRGRYRLRCTHAFHSALGMRGEILVE